MHYRWIKRAVSVNDQPEKPTSGHVDKSNYLLGLSNYLLGLSMSGWINRWKVLLVSTAFFLSGGCGLVYEVLWTRYLADLMGATSLSQFVVLMVFMGGLALGAILVGRLVDRGHNGLVYYGWLEVGIGLYAVLFPFLFGKVSGVFVSIGADFELGSPALLALKLLTASLLIVIPSVAMGGTLPAVTRYLTRGQSSLRRNISMLYGVNSLGAVTGVLAGGFFLVYRYGLSRSMMYVGGFNLALGLVALMVAWVVKKNGEFYSDSDKGDHHRREELADTQEYRPYAVKRAIAAAGLSGFAAMALQIAWIRYFVIILGATHSAFTIVVAAFIFGLGLGAFLVRSKWVGRLPLPTVLTGAFALISATLVVSLFFYARLPFEAARFLSIIAPTPYAWPFHLILKFGLCFAVMLFPSVASGMILPLCVRIASRSGGRIGRDVARVYAVNTLGALLGIGITSQLLFRTLTLPRTLQSILLIYLAATIFLAFILKERGRKRILMLTGVLLALHFTLWQPWSPQQLHVSRIEFGAKQPIRYEDFIESNKQRVLIEDRQGPDVQVTVLDDFRGATTNRLMFINGKPDASNIRGNNDFSTEVLLGHLPVLLHPNPESAFVLGLGSGITSGEILKFSGIKRVVSVELAAEVFEASKTFAADNGRFWENPKHRMIIDDGKTFLRLTEDKFDVIAMEPTNIWQEGMAGLFSEEFFKLVKSRLAEGGIVAQWLHTYDLDDLTFNIVLKTFSRVFPAASIFEVSEGDILLVGYNGQWQFDPVRLEHRFYQPQILESQREVGNANPAALLLREVMSRDDFREHTSIVKAPVNTDNFPVLEKAAEYGRFINSSVSILKERNSRLKPDGKDLLILDYFKKLGIDQNQLHAIIKSKIFAEDRFLRSLKFLLLNRLLAESRGLPEAILQADISDPQLLNVINNPAYRMAVEDMTTREAYSVFNGEMVIWYKAASQLWSPSPERLRQLFKKVSLGVARETVGVRAFNTAISLSSSLACDVALDFFHIAEEKGALEPEKLRTNEMINIFYCEMKEGEPGKAMEWWKLIEQQNKPEIAVLEEHKASLDIKLGGQPPPPVYGRLPNRR
jgi:spermidine synthase